MQNFTQIILIYNKMMSTAELHSNHSYIYNKMMSTAELHSNQSYITK